MGVFIPIPIGDLEQERERPSLTYHLDLTRGRIVNRVDGLEAVNQAIRKALLTPRFRCVIYGNQYGSEIKQTIIAGDATREYFETEMPRLVKEALLIDSRVLDAYDFSFSFKGEQASICFTAKTVFGDTAIEEVI